ncbi:isoprenylcysteine carboxylmethyltransferase family protein [Candidatus Gottesmanbacteria bacterium]|nr:isoprenylcysteine carboxylmethyltransferase family protein [Candidatus Gottesmanbacteria bacterium]
MKKISLPSDSSQVIAPPPLIYLSGLVVGAILHWLKPLPFLPETLTLPLSTILVVTSIALITTAFRAFRKAKTTIHVHKPTTKIVTTGPYRFSRNPIYLSMTLLTIGIAILVNTLWILVMLIPVLLVMQFGVIAREEAYLTKKFGDEYLHFKSKVRRWL